MRHTLRIAVLLLATGLVVLAAGCGGSKNAGSTTGPNGQTVPTGNFTSEENCLMFAGLADQVAGTVSSVDNGNVASDIETTASQLQALADAAPSDIKADLQTIASAFAGYVQAIKDSGYEPGSFTAPTEAQIAAFERGVKSFTTAKVTQAAQRLVEWQQKHCK